MEGADQLTLNWRSVALACVLASILVAQFYILSRGIERRASAWFTAFAVAIAITTIPMIIGFAGAYDIWPGLTFLPTDLTLLFGPLLLFHARQLLDGAAPRGQYWLLAPGAIYWLYQLWAFTMLGDYRAKWAFNDAVHEPFVVPLVMVTAIALSAWSLWEILRMRRGYKAWLDANRSDGDDFEPTWIGHFIVLGVVAAAIWALETALYLSLGLSYVDAFWWDLAVLAAIMLLSLEALTRLTQPYPKMLAPDAVSIEQLVESANTERERDWQAEGERLRDQVIANGWHLESSLSLQTLSRRFGMNQAYVSRALNQGLGTSFSHFVNALRVEHARSMILREEVNLLDVALSSGFGSKASFNRAFKAHAGVTPSEYKRLNS
ncbi:transcriptional regulator araC family protein [Erythrobacter sp. NAP1]|uniref:helix-turn-helix domain-containing protein n=1 Tax=Erythrobacter sp. NAP1 TaxID=237727 RepID=UPI00006879DE|nr:AraC family transcriptional regulator [Erythrobacter sp. NAP1]EAQ28027.1 transcriptional regulator araC family protein [Erythrobacter sp. NAP1]